MTDMFEWNSAEIEKQKQFGKMFHYEELKY